jgi:serine/threonine protein kinase
MPDVSASPRTIWSAHKPDIDGARVCSRDPVFLFNRFHARPESPLVDDATDALRRAPSTFGKYEIVRRIAAGGMAEIYLAQLVGPDGFRKPLVVKRVHEYLLERPEFAEMFLREAKIAAMLSHPNIAHVFEFGRIEGIPFISMEFVDGASVDLLMRAAAKSNTTLGPAIAGIVGLAVCEALHYAHDITDENRQWLGLVHRDVSPGNILIGRDGVVKLVDFGIVKLRGSTSTQTGQVKGKFAYMAPEQALGHPIDRRADIFSLGVVLYEIAVGKRLFRRGTDAESITAMLGEPIPAPSVVVPGFPPALESILLQALDRAPDQRFATAHDMQEALFEYLAAENLVATARRRLAQLMSVVFPEPTRDAGQSSETSNPSGARSIITPPDADAPDPVPTVTAERPKHRPARASQPAPDRRSMTPWIVLALALLLTAAFWSAMLVSQ